MGVLTADSEDLPRGYLKVRSVFGCFGREDGVEVLAFADRFWVNGCGEIVSVHDTFEAALEGLGYPFGVDDNVASVWSTRHTAAQLAARFEWLTEPVDGYTIRVNDEPWRYDADLSRFQPVSARSERRQRSGRESN